MKLNRFKVIAIVSAFILAVIYLIVAISNKNDNHLANQELIEQHAHVIADDLWRFDKSSANNYLKLAIESNHYKNITVLQSNSSVFLNIDNTHESKLDKLLINLHLIKTKTYTNDIIENKSIIGTLIATIYIRNIYYNFNKLLLFILLFFIINFISYLQFSRKSLNQTVMERTTELQEKEEDLSITLNSIGDAVISTDIYGNISRINPVALHLLNVNDSALGLPIADVLEIYDYENEKIIPLDISKIIQKNDTDHLNRIAYFLQQDMRKSLKITASLMHDKKSICTGIVIIISDITEMKKLEHKLIQSQKLESIGLLAGGVAHDLNNILSGIINYPELILLQLPADSPLRNPVQKIIDSGIRASEIVSDLLTVARGVASEKIVTNLNILIEDYFSSPEFQKLGSSYPSITYEKTLNTDLHNTLCSPVHIIKCIMNIITNGIESIEGDKGKITISTYNTFLDRQVNKYMSNQKGDYSVLQISDNGSGINQRDIAHLFEPFYTKKKMGRSGTGLGLTIVWNAMSDMNGTIDITSNTNGTTFCLYFPASTAAITDKTEEMSLSILEGNGESILIVDDEDIQIEVASLILKRLKYTVTTAKSGQEAIDIAKTQPFDLILLDMIMENGMNGYDTYKEIIKTTPNQKAIIASGFAENEEVQKTQSLGAGQYIKKPYTIQVIGTAVKASLNH